MLSNCCMSLVGCFIAPDEITQDNDIPKISSVSYTIALLLASAL